MLAAAGNASPARSSKTFFSREMANTGVRKRTEVLVFTRSDLLCLRENFGVVPTPGQLNRTAFWTGTRLSCPECSRVGTSGHVFGAIIGRRRIVLSSLIFAAIAI